VKLVMTSTAIYPALSGRPALLSPRVSSAELRGRVGFDGVSITDDLTVPALRRYGSLAANGREATQAGNDLLLYCSGYAPAAGAADALVRDARAGRLSVPAMRASVRRVLGLRAGLG
jgi:beta-N-acetylhexosaminidase